MMIVCVCSFIGGIEVALTNWNDQGEEEEEQDEEEGDDGLSERDHEVPKKKRRIALNNSADFDNDEEESDSSRSPSVTESLIQFEALEKEMLNGGGGEGTGVVFRTSATSTPFQNPDEDFSQLFFNIAALVADDAADADDFHETLKPLSPVAERKWCSVENVATDADTSTECNRKEAGAIECRRSQSACDFDVSYDIPENERKNEEEGEEGAISQGQTAVWNNDDDDDDVEPRELNEEDDWEPDGFLPSADEEYYEEEEEDSCSSGTDYSAERDDQLDDLNLGFLAGNGRSERSSSLARMRSFRSYDSLNLIDCCSASVSGSSHSTASSDSSSPMDRSSPEDQQLQQQQQQQQQEEEEEEKQRRRHHHHRHRSAEALSEDSGYGDAAMLWSSTTTKTTALSPSWSSEAVVTLGLPVQQSQDPCSPPSPTICPPDGAPSSPQLLPEEVDEDEGWGEEEAEEREGGDEWKEEEIIRRRPAPLSLKEAEEFLQLQPIDAVGGNTEEQKQNSLKGGSEAKRCGGADDDETCDVVICINLECEMSHTSVAAAASAEFMHGTIVAEEGNVASTDQVDDDIRSCGNNPQQLSAVTDLETSNFNPANDDDDDDDGGGTASHEEEVEQRNEGEEEEHSLQQQQLLAQGSSFIRSPDVWNHKLPDAGQNVTCFSSSPSSSSSCLLLHNQTDNDDAADDALAMDSAFYPVPVVLKRYGPRQEVEVYISQEQQIGGGGGLNNVNQPFQDSPSSLDDVVASNAVAGIRGVHFSPVVSAVNWRESYLDASDEDSAPEEDGRRQQQQDEPEEDEEDNEEEDEEDDLDLELVRIGDTESTGSGRVPSSPITVSPPQKVIAVTTVGADAVVATADATSPSIVQQVNPIVEPEKTVKQPPPEVPSQPNNSKKSSSASGPGLFQRFSLSRLSARMSATFGRSDSKQRTNESSPPPPPAPANGNNDVATNTKKEKNKNKNKKSEPVVHPQPEPPVKKSVDQVKSATISGKPESKRRSFFIRPFQRSSSTPPISLSVITPSSKKPEAISSPSSSSFSSEPKEDQLVAQQPIPSTTITTTTTTTASHPTPPALPVNPPVASRSPTASPSPTPPTASSRVLVSPAAAKPPLPPRALQAQRKLYLVQQHHQHQSLDSAAAAPPVPMVSSAGLQMALQHFKESARMERERLANSVPDLAGASPQLSPSTRPTSDCGAGIDPGVSTTHAPQQQTQTPSPPSLPPRHPISSLTSRERARLAILTRACSVESAWNATASQAALNLSRRHIASSSSGGSGGGSQGHAYRSPSAHTTTSTSSRSAVPGLLETNLDSLSFSGGDGCDTDDTDRSSYNQETNLDELIQNLQQFAIAKRAEYSSGGGGAGVGGGDASAAAAASDKRFKSMLNLGSSNSAPVSVKPDINNMMSMSMAVGGPTYADPNRAKSMEFLLDEDNKTQVQVRTLLFFFFILLLTLWHSFSCPL